MLRIRLSQNVLRLGTSPSPIQGVFQESEYPRGSPDHHNEARQKKRGRRPGDFQQIFLQEWSGAGKEQ